MICRSEISRYPELNACISRPEPTESFAVWRAVMDSVAVDSVMTDLDEEQEQNERRKSNSPKRTAILDVAMIQRMQMSGVSLENGFILEKSFDQMDCTYNQTDLDSE